MLATLVDTTALWKIVAVVLLVGVGGTALFGQGAISAERLVDARRRNAAGAVIANAVVVGLTAVACVGALVVGLIAMTHK